MARARTELVHCDNCGEDYAATYRRCPFCNAKAGQRFDDYDAEEPGGEDAVPRRGGKRLAGGAPSSGGGGDPARIAIYVLAALVIVAVICILISVVIPKLVAPAPAESAAPTETAAPSESAAVQSALPSAEGSGVSDDPAMSFHPLPVVDGMEGDDPLSLDSPDLPTVGPDVVSSPAASATPAPTPAASPSTAAGLRLSSTDFTLSPRYPTYQLECGLGRALVTYSVKNEAVATVSSTGLVTAVGDGNTTITVTDQNGATATAIVRVSGISGQSGGAGEAPASQAPASEAPAGDARLTYGGRTITEFSITARHPEPITLKVQGGEAASWRVKNESVATVSDGGTVTGVGDGSTTVECTLTDGTVLRCTVHVDGL